MRVHFAREGLSHPSPLLSQRALNTAYAAGFLAGDAWEAEHPAEPLPTNLGFWIMGNPCPVALGLTRKQAVQPRYVRAIWTRYVYGCVSGAEQPRINQTLGLPRRQEVTP